MINDFVFTKDITIIDRVIASLQYSLKSFLPTKIIDIVKKIDLFSSLRVGKISNIVGWFEMIIGMTLSAIILFSLGKWFKERFE